MSRESVVISFSFLQELFELLPQAKNSDVGRIKNRLISVKKTVSKTLGKKNPAELAQSVIPEKYHKSIEQLHQAVLTSIEAKQQEDWLTSLKHSQ